MPFIPDNPDLSKYPPEMRERVYREHRALLNRQYGELGLGLSAWGFLLFVLLVVPAIAALVTRCLGTSP